MKPTHICNYIIIHSPIFISTSPCFEYHSTTHTTKLWLHTHTQTHTHTHTHTQFYIAQTIYIIPCDIN